MLSMVAKQYRQHTITHINRIGNMFDKYRKSYYRNTTTAKRIIRTISTKNTSPLFHRISLVVLYGHIVSLENALRNLAPFFSINLSYSNTAQSELPLINLAFYATY